MNPNDYLFERQLSWARRHGIATNSRGYIPNLNDNFFLPLTAEAYREFAGNPTGDPEHELHAPHSSAALAVNVFFYWRLYRDLGPIISILCPDLDNYEVNSIHFEAPVPIAWPDGLRAGPPMLDVLIRYQHEEPSQVPKAIAIESKFREPYGNGNHQGGFADRYVIPENAAIWSGLEPLHQLAVQIHGGEFLFNRLHVAQLIKHILGLNSTFNGSQNFELIYLWYPASGPEAVLHGEEIIRFQKLTDACCPRVNFRAIRYDDLIHALAHSHGGVHGTYIDYLMERYF